MTGERRAGAGMARLVATVALVVPAIIGATASSSRADAGDTLWTTGLGADGQLGDARTASRTTFGPVSGLVDVDAVRGGREHLVALVGGLSTVTSIAAGH
jgi:alpha-tubulin suppressor-like RCC1 family protein